MTRQGSAVLGAALLLAGPAGADGFSIDALGEVPTREECLERAQEVLGAYAERFGGSEVFTVDWASYVYDLRPGDQDATIMCPIVREDGAVLAMMVVYGEEPTEENRAATAAEIQRLWDG